MGDCDESCHEIYDSDDTHTIRRDGRRILGNEVRQFCEAFYHVHEWSGRRHSCLDDDNCSIARRAQEHEPHKWTLQPKTVVALAKFEVDGKINYEARYTNCHGGKKHAEDFFGIDIQKGTLSEICNTAKETGTKLITLYLTYQPCNKSTTDREKSCCDVLKEVYSKVLQPQSISLCIKATHSYRLDQKPAKEKSDEALRKNAISGIKQLIESGVNVSSMNEEDWTYLFRLTSANIPGADDLKNRKSLDETIKGIFEKL